jgi:cytosine/adenosine deaminase-related metal-dependent hydrolase
MSTAVAASAEAARKVSVAMSSGPMSDDEQPEVDDSTLSEVVRRPTRTAGDLSGVADASPGITTEDLARDLEAVASKRGVPTDRELLADLLRRVERIEQHLGITN